MKKLYSLLISLWTLEALTVAVATVCLAGSLMLPSNLAFFSGIDDTPLFKWLGDNAEPAKTWWIYALVVLMGLLAFITALCMADAVVKAVGRKDFLRKLYPQLMHLGVLLVLLGYLLTAWKGIRTDVPLNEGQSASLHDGATVTLIKAGTDSEKKDYYDDWVLRVSVMAKGSASAAEATISPNHPFVSKASTLFFRSITIPPADSGKTASALIRVVSDPGKLWALWGGILVLLGGAAHLISRRRIQSPEAD